MKYKTGDMFFDTQSRKFFILHKYDKKCMGWMLRWPAQNNRISNHVFTLADMAKDIHLGNNTLLQLIFQEEQC